MITSPKEGDNESFDAIHYNLVIIHAVDNELYR